MTKNPNVAAIDSAQFGMWLVSHLWGNFAEVSSLQVTDAIMA